MWGSESRTWSARRALAAMCATVLLVTVAGCGGETPAASPAATTTGPVPAAASTTEGPTTTVLVTYPPNGETVDVQALDNTFRVQDLTVEVGTEVRWTNVGRNQHNVVAVARTAADVWGVEDKDFQPGQSFSHVFDHPGVFEYVCTIHGVEGRGMIGSVTVTG